MLHRAMIPAERMAQYPELDALMKVNVWFHSPPFILDFLTDTLCIFTVP